jgi:hypothetical protein
LRLNPSDELRYPDYRVLRFLLENPSVTKYYIEDRLSKEKKLADRKLQWSHGTLYGAVRRLKKDHFIEALPPEVPHPGHSVESYKLTLAGFFRALRSCFLTRTKVDMHNVAANYSGLLPEILGQWRIFEKNDVAGLAESRLMAVSLDLDIQLGLKTIMVYRRRRSHLIPKKRLEAVKINTKAQVMRIFLFGAHDDEPFPTGSGKVNWTLSLQQSPDLRKWALRIARNHMNHYATAATRWKTELEELTRLSTSD